ncbi:hypothetical protein ACRALDRAFT_1065711, partial [Sodiomyces alcalophilus JCM 7366]|uniref:uncharacterized protein n=1 Tax=Sodiomyces alcalophilus JCM 7366 TaxID=591952 RepID=UPI0039B42879
MASVSPQHHSPYSASPYGFTNDEYEDWNDIEQASSGRSNSNSICLVPSPASDNLGGLTIIGHSQHSPAGPSPSPPTMPLLYHDAGYGLDFGLGLQEVPGPTTFQEQTHGTPAIPVSSGPLNDSNHFLSPGGYFGMSATYPP